jgi:mannose-6-phosphate isomerase-like protein (cupin superfamily)
VDQRLIIRGNENDPFKASGMENDGRLDLIVLDVGYGFGPPLHTHISQEDTFYVVDGVLTVQLDDDVVELAPGDFGTAPPGVAHSFTNAHRDQVVRLVNVMTPGIGFDRYIKRVTGPEGLSADELDELQKEYGVEVVGPSVAERLGLS